jgi:hypothetical protein
MDSFVPNVRELELLGVSFPPMQLDLALFQRPPRPNREFTP